MPCLFKPDMHHTWLCIMTCLCDGCLLFCVLPFPVLLLRVGSGNIALVRTRSSMFRLSSSWTRSSSLRDFRQDDRYPGSHYYHCYASCFVLSLCCVSYLLLIKPPMLPWTSKLDTFPMQTLVWLCYRFCSAPLIALLVAGEVEDCSMLEHAYVGISQYLLFN